jgi:hypothetical protein
MTATILRHRRRANFTVLPNEALRDASLSFRATGLLAYLLSLPEGSSIDSLTLSKRKPEGRDAIRTAFRELEEAGYVRRSKEKNDQNQWQTVTEISDQRMVEPGPENPASGSQATDSRASGDQALCVKNREQEPGQEPPLPPKGGVAKVDDTDADFDAFYTRYPRKVGKPAAKRAYRTARKKADAETIAAGLSAWMPYWQAKNDMELVPHPSTWLNQERWNDIPPPIAVKNLSAAQSVAEKKQRLFGTGGS